jgi:hypothetical protein
MPPSDLASVRLMGLEVEVSLGLRLEKRKGFGLLNLELRGEDEMEHLFADRIGAWLSRSISLYLSLCVYGWFCGLCFLTCSIPFASKRLLY